MTPGQSLQRIRSAGLLLAFELFVAAALAISYYYAIRPYGVFGDSWSLHTFAAYAEKNHLADQPELFPTWQGRLGGLLYTGALYDWTVHENDMPTQAGQHFDDIFAFYHSVGLLLLFLCIICALRNSLFINLGIFGGLIYNLSPANGPNFYPWDMPAVLFFTLAVILFQRRQPVLMLVVCCIGYFFKETVLILAVLLFFNNDWFWKKNLLVFCLTVAFCLVVKKLLLMGLHLDTAVLSMADAHSFSGLLNFTFLQRNLQTLLSLNLNHALFANTGTLVIMLVLVGHKRFRPYSILIWLFVIGQMFYGTIKEFRIFAEVLPLSWILLIGYWKDWQAARDITPHPESMPDTAWAPRLPPAVFTALVIFLLVVVSLAFGLRYVSLADFRDPGRPARAFKQWLAKAQANDPGAEFEVGKLYLRGEGTATNLVAACDWLEKATEAGNPDAALLLARTLESGHQWQDAVNAYYLALHYNSNSVPALNGLARIRATAADSKLRDAREAMRLSQRAGGLTEYKEAAVLQTWAAGFASAGMYNEAILTADQAIEKARQNQQHEILEQTERMLILFKQHKPYHEAPDPTP